MSAKVYIVNGRGVIPLLEYQDQGSLLASIVTGESFQRGVLPFDVMEARGNVCFKLDDHLRRFVRALKKCDIIIPKDEEGLAYYVQDALADAKIPEAKIRIDVVMGDEVSRKALAIMLQVSPFPKSKPLTLVTAEYLRSLPDMKFGGDYLFAQIERRKHNGVDDILYVNPLTKRISEASRANFYAVKNLGAKSRVYGLQHSQNILNGITRQTMKSVLKDERNRSLAASIEEAGELHIDELGAMDEVFMTSSGIRVAPVRRINDLTWDLGTGRLGGRVTRELAVAFNVYLEEYYAKYSKF